MARDKKLSAPEGKLVGHHKKDTTNIMQINKENVYESREGT